MRSAACNLVNFLINSSYVSPNVCGVGTSTACTPSNAKPETSL
jgi:hypothetical protein